LVPERIKVIDWDNPANNHFLLVSQLWVTGEMYKRRPDLVGFVNGLPLVVAEFKAVTERVEAAFKDNITDYRQTIPHLFVYNGLILVSNGVEGKMGSVTAAWEHYCDWKKISSEAEPGSVSLETLVKGTCDKTRLLDLVENFTLFEERAGKIRKVVAKNHQYLGVNNAISALLATLTPALSRGERGQGPQYRGGFQFSGLVERARELRRKKTPAEEVLWELLRERRFLGLKFRRQHQFGDYITDFYCHEAKLVVETDGPVHNTTAAQKKDRRRDAYLKSLGLEVVRLPNELVLEQPETALERVAAKLPCPLGRRAGDEGKTHTGLGVFWQTQGSGKTYAMVFFAQKVLRKIPGNWTFVGVTDRNELDDQLYKNFASVGVVTEPEDRVRAASAEHLKQLLTEDHRYVFTLIQKFRTEKGQRFPKLSSRDDIIVMTDEAHRTQYDIFAMNMRDALPKAAFIGFTGTPLIAGEEKTKEVFGDYVSIYDFKQSVDDGATVPLFYENRIPELQLTNEQLNEDIYRVIEDAELDEEQQRKLERVLGQQYHLITREERLDKIAADIVQHFTGRGFKGKAMVVCIDKLTAVRMYDKVKAAWAAHEAELKKSLATATPEEQDAILDTLNWMKTTDMAVVLSQAQNEVADFKAKGLDITPHRQRMVKEDLETKFKDPDDPFRLVFVCAMWMTGFDVPSCSTIYLDKPLRNHTLMQTIARANRVFGEKVNGLIVDYVGVFRDLQKALFIYAGGGAGGGGGRTPVEKKAELIAMLKKAIAETVDFCKQRGVDVDAILQTKALERVRALQDAREAILVTDDSKRQFLALAGRTSVVYRAILPDTAASQFAPHCALFMTLADMIRALLPPVDISGVMQQIEAVLDKSVGASGYTIEEGAKPLDLSRIDFDALRKFCKKAHKRAEIERLRAAITAKLRAMLAQNRTRVDFWEKFQELIDEYNAGSANLEAIFEELLKFAKKLNEEEQRHVREQMTEEELAICDILTKPRVDITAKEEKEVKKVAKDMLQTLKANTLVLDWRKRQQTRAAVRLCIEEWLDKLPPVYTRAIYQTKCDAVYQHVYDMYGSAGLAT
jgi:type I restriction enzyme R subunit